MSPINVDTVNRCALLPGHRTHLAALQDRLSDDAFRWAGKLAEAVVVDTCERFEIYTSSASLSHRPPPRPPYAVHLEGADALRHLFRVASGLESRLRGETEILGQVRAAHVASLLRDAGGPVLRVAFTDAIRAGRRVRRETSLGSAATAYPAITVERLARQLGDLSRRHVAVVGTGAMGRAVARLLAATRRCRVTLVGRDRERTDAAARGLAVAPLPLDEFLAGGASYDAVVTALRLTAPVIGAQTRVRSPLFVDLGAIPNVDPGISTRRIGLEDLAGERIAVASVKDATALVDAMAHACAERITWLEKRRVGLIARSAS